MRISAEQITAAIAKAFGKKLSLIGGTMTGALTVNNTVTATNATVNNMLKSKDFEFTNVGKIKTKYSPIAVEGFNAGADGNIAITNNAYLNSTEFIGSEKVYKAPNTSYTAISLANGNIQYITGTTCTLPAAPVNYVTNLTIICSASSMTWGGQIVWQEATAPSFAAGTNIVNFLGFNGKWYGSFAGTFK